MSCGCANTDKNNEKSVVDLVRNKNNVKPAGINY